MKPSFFFLPFMNFGNDFNQKINTCKGSKNPEFLIMIRTIVLNEYLPK